MSKMRKEYDPNKVKRRKRKPIVYIICEGKETETLYFKHFRSRNCLVDIIPLPSKHKAAEHLVKHAKSLISQADYYPKDGDQLWCVFDCDDNKDSELQAAISYSEKHGYKIAYSNPAFEYWYLLHFEKRNGYLKDSATVIDILKNKGYLENYGKSVDVFEELQEHQPEAIQYAKEHKSTITKVCIMTESCHFDDKDSLGGSFCVWRGGSIMATTRIMPLHVGKGRTESRAISDIIDYVVNPQKTDNGRLITGFACDSRMVDAGFLLTKRQYIVATGRVHGRYEN